MESKDFSSATGTLRLWAVACLVLTLTFVIAYLSTQQSLRMSANDPQVQMARDAASDLARGLTPTSLQAPPGSERRVDMTRSLSPWVTTFGEDTQPLTSTAELEGQTPSLPPGVFEYARTHGENRLTWQPRPGVRQAIVLVHFSGEHSGFVLAGRSLAEVQERIATLGKLVLAAWLASVVVLGLAALALAASQALVRRRTADASAA